MLFVRHVGWCLDTTPLGNKLKFEGLGVWERGFGKEDVAVTIERGYSCSDLAVSWTTYSRTEALSLEFLEWSLGMEIVQWTGYYLEISCTVVGCVLQHYLCLWPGSSCKQQGEFDHQVLIVWHLVQQGNICAVHNLGYGLACVRRIWTVLPWCIKPCWERLN